MSKETERYDMFIRLKWDSPDQEKRWQEIKKILSKKNNAKAFKKLLEVVKL